MAARRRDARLRTHIVRHLAQEADSDDEIFFSHAHTCPLPGQDAPLMPLHGPHARERCSSLMDGLLFDIYDRWHYRQRDSLDSDTVTECSSTSDAFLGRADSLQLELDHRHSRVFNQAVLWNKSTKELVKMRSDLHHRINQISARLVRQLKRRDRGIAKRGKNYDVITAIIQASSLKRRIDTRLRFSVEPLPGADAFQQWCDAMKAVARLPMGIPPEFRKKVWLSLADYHLFTLKLDWEKTVKFAFNERTNPDDDNLGLQIVKDLHRTGCSGFSGHDNEEERAVLKRVLLAYARWNKAVGYCQGFNVLAALVLDVVDRKEDDALKVLIYLIDHVLPESYFANNLRALSVDMAVFRDLLHLHHPHLSSHLDHLQAAAGDQTSGVNYEPPLTNVFTMQWFLTLFATCLPQATALRVWDSVLLEGSEVLLRTALAIWGTLSDGILSVQSADEFYTTMGVFTQEMLDEGKVDPDELIKEIYSMAPFPFPQLSDLREKYTYNITPFSAAMSTGRRPTGRHAGVMFSDDDELDDDDLVDQINCFTGLFPYQVSPSKNKPLGATDRSQSGSAYDISKVSPGAYAVTSDNSTAPAQPSYMERMTMDIDQLNMQYKRLRERQKQAHIILAAASAKHLEHRAKSRSQTDLHPPQKPVITGVVAPPIQSPVAVNHLFIGRKNSSYKRNRHVADAPGIAPFYPKGGHNTQLVGIQDQRLGAIKASDKNDIAKIRHEYEMQRKKNDEPCTKTSGRGCVKEDSKDKPVITAKDRTTANLVRNAMVQEDSSSYGLCDGTTSNKAKLIENSPERALGVSPCQKPTLLQLSQMVDEGPITAKSNASSVSSKDEHSHSPSTGPNLSSLELGSGAPTQITRSKSPCMKSGPSSPCQDSGSVIPCQESRSRSPCQESESRSRSCSSVSSSEGMDSVAALRVFNPFPNRHMNLKRAQNGLRLGLYSAESLPIIDKQNFRKAGVQKQYVSDRKSQPVSK